jgi:PAS domain S-box-containing protein
MRKYGIIAKVWISLLFLIIAHIAFAAFEQFLSRSLSGRMEHVSTQARPFAEESRNLLHTLQLAEPEHESAWIAGDAALANNARTTETTLESSWGRLQSNAPHSATWSNQMNSTGLALSSFLEAQQALAFMRKEAQGEASDTLLPQFTDLVAKKRDLTIQLSALNTAAQAHLLEQVQLLQENIQQKNRADLLFSLLTLITSVSLITLGFTKYILGPLRLLLRLVRGETDRIPMSMPSDEIGELANRFLAFRNEQQEHAGHLEEQIKARTIAEKELLHHQENLEQIIVERTRSIRDKNQQLHRSTAELMKSEELLRTVFTSMHEGLCLCNLINNAAGDPVDYRIVLVNPAFEEITGISSDQAQGALYTEIYPNAEIPFFDTYVGVVQSGTPVTFETYMANLGKHLSISATKSGKLRFTMVMSDISEQKTIEAELQRAQKLESVGQLAAGIAHEINTPIQFIGDNIHFMKDVFEDFFSLQEAINPLLESGNGTRLPPELVAAALKKKEQMDYPYLVEEIPTTITQTLDGVKRVSSIVLAMRDFAHPSNEVLQPADLNKTIESTMIVTRNEWKYVAEVKTNFEDSMPLVSCLRDEFSQVILNLIINARDAIQDHNKEGELGLITISTSYNATHAQITVSDNGGGIPANIVDRIFDPFFTTKEVGRGSGQGLAIAHNIVAQKHKGDLTVTSEEEVGTTFVIRLPL